jgi:hypothetical protein
LWLSRPPVRCPYACSSPYETSGPLAIAVKAMCPNWTTAFGAIQPALVAPVTT